MTKEKTMIKFKHIEDSVAFAFPFNFKKRKAVKGGNEYYAYKYYGKDDYQIDLKAEKFKDYRLILNDSSNDLTLWYNNKIERLIMINTGAYPNPEAEDDDNYNIKYYIEIHCFDFDKELIDVLSKEKTAIDRYMALLTKGYLVESYNRLTA